MFVKGCLPSGRIIVVSATDHRSHRNAHEHVNRLTRDGRLAQRFGITLFVSSNK
jgi:hypothetical protein